MDDLLPLAARERRALADVLDTLTSEQWAAPSRCEGWTVRDVTAHLLFVLEHSLLATVVVFARNGANLDRMTKATTAADRRDGPRLVAALRTHAESRRTPPGFTVVAPLTDVVVHAQDICAPLGIVHPVDPASARLVLDFVVSAKATKGFLPRGRFDGLRLAATDLNWASGTGAEVRGPTADLVSAMLGRPAALSALSGDGVALLGERIAPPTA